MQFPRRRTHRIDLAGIAPEDYDRQVEAAAEQIEHRLAAVGDMVRPTDQGMWASFKNLLTGARTPDPADVIRKADVDGPGVCRVHG